MNQICWYYFQLSTYLVIDDSGHWPDMSYIISISVIRKEFQKTTILIGDEPDLVVVFPTFINSGY